MGEDRIHTFLTLIGRVSVVSDGRYVKAVYFPSDNLPAMEEGTYPLTEEAETEISEYLTGSRKDFDLPLRQEGTEFQQAVWEAIQDIPYGQTLSYGKIAEAIGHPGAFRAVGTACGGNRIPIIIPCHRVVASNGLGGYAGGLVLKKRLLDLERDSL